MDRIKIESYSEYELCTRNGFEPLIDSRFTLAIQLRIQIQNELFGGGLSQRNIARGNLKFYHWVWDNKPHICEETGTEIFEYSSKHVSHILSRKGWPEIRWDPRNTNILIVPMHTMWERFPEKMNIYQRNIEVIEMLKKEYNHV